MTRRHTWQDPRRVRRLAALFETMRSIDLYMTAADLDARAADIEHDNPAKWARIQLLAAHYLREMGRTRT